MSSTPLPRLVIDLVAARRSVGHSPKRIVRAVRHLLRNIMRPIHRAMYSCDLVSVRSNAKAFRSLYTEGGLASQLCQAASAGAGTIEARLTEISEIILRRLGHILGLLRPIKRDLYDRLMNMAGTGLPPREFQQIPNAA